MDSTPLDLMLRSGRPESRDQGAFPVRVTGPGVFEMAEAPSNGFRYARRGRGKYILY